MKREYTIAIVGLVSAALFVVMLVAARQGKDAGTFQSPAEDLQSGLVVGADVCSFEDMADGDIVVQVNGDTLSKKELIDRTLAIAAVMKLRTPSKANADLEIEARRHLPSVLFAYVLKRLYLQEAARINLKEDSEIREDVQSKICSMVRGGQKPSYQEALDSLPKKMASALLNTVNEDIMSQSLIAYVSGTNLTVSAADIDRVEKAIIAFNERAAISNDVNARLSQEVYVAATNGADFAELAKKFSDWNSEDGILWGPWDCSDLKVKSPEVLAWAREAKPGDIIGPIDVDDGRSIIKFVSHDHLEDLDDPELSEEYSFQRVNFKVFTEHPKRTRDQIAEEVKLHRKERQAKALADRLWYEAKIEYPHGTNLFNTVRQQVGHKEDKNEKTND